jgi:hypothetical protein
MLKCDRAHLEYDQAHLDDLAVLKLKLAYKCHSFLFYTYGDAPGVPFLVIFVFFLAFGALNSNSFVSVLILMK